MSWQRLRGSILLEWVIVWGILAIIWPSVATSVRGVYQVVGQWVDHVVCQYDSEYWQDQIRYDVNQASAVMRMGGWLTVRHPDAPLIQYDIRNTCLRRRLYRNHRWYSYSLVCGLSDWTVDIVPRHVRIEYRDHAVNGCESTGSLIIGYACEAV